MSSGPFGCRSEASASPGPFTVFGRPLSCIDQTVVAVINRVVARGLPPSALPLPPIILAPTPATATQESWQLAFVPFTPNQGTYGVLQVQFLETQYVWTVERRDTPCVFRGFYVKLVPR